jgi:ferredoxin
MEEFVERKLGDLTIRIDRGTCIGSANCIGVAEDVFVIDDTGICSFQGNPAGIERDRLIEACRVCPVDALYVFDAEGKQLVPEGN